LKKDVMTQQRLELWGGVECTINRVGDRFLDQLKRSAHLTRPSDIDRFAELGLSALRFPVLWERACEDAGAKPSFAALLNTLERTRERGLRVIAGLCHHGSGPRGTHLLDPSFEAHFAEYAQRVAEEFPWIEDYTPVNEPLTTARFSCLYGHWFPHAHDTRSFLRALVLQCRSTISAMEAIRKVQPRARLVQTEDIATIRSSPSLDYQAAYENERRFLSLDLLAGRVDRQHPLFAHLLDQGIGEDELAFFQEHACPPDLIGVNYYFTSDRYLDVDLTRHPAFVPGGNGKDTYVDVDAARAGIGIVGHRDTLRLVWERYEIPLVIGEVHAGCTREEQVRWLCEAWQGALAAQEAGADVRAVTAWALLGSFDWNSLVTRDEGVYESGVFDLRSLPPRPTALAQVLCSLADHGTYEHPLLAAPGWWRRNAQHGLTARGPQGRPVLIAGAPGTLARALAHACEIRGLAYVLLPRPKLDIANADQVRDCLRSLKPWAVLNAAGFACIDDAERAPLRCHRENYTGPTVLAGACSQAAVRLVHFSSDQVFNGGLRKPYVESDAVGPLSTYGLSQVAAERAVLERAPEALIVRTSGLFGPWDDTNTLTRTLRRLTQGQVVHIPCASVISPTYLPHLADVALDLLVDAARGVWHLANVGATTWAELVEKAAELQKLPRELLRPMSDQGMAPRPPYSVLGSERAALMPTLDEALDRYLRDRASTREDVELHSA
jgi:dTDP-4-dehydrorhamnose reductase